MVGGVAVDEAFLARLARDRAIVVSLIYPGGVPSRPVPRQRRTRTDDAAVGELEIPVIRTAAGHSRWRSCRPRLEVTQPLTPLRALLRSADSWFLMTAAGTGVTALLLAVWVSSRISRPLAALAEKTAVLRSRSPRRRLRCRHRRSRPAVPAAWRPCRPAAHQHRPRARGRTARHGRRARAPDQPRHQERPHPASERDAPSGAGRTRRAGRASGGVRRAAATRSIPASRISRRWPPATSGCRRRSTGANAI